MAKTNLHKFIKETKQEALKVSWPSRKETTITTVIVFIMIAIMAVVMFAADAAIATGIKAVLGFGG